MSCELRESGYLLSGCVFRGWVISLSGCSAGSTAPGAVAPALGGSEPGQCPALCFALGKALRGDSPHHSDEVTDGTGGKYCGVAWLRQRLRTWLDPSGGHQPGCSVSPAWHRGGAGCLQPPCCARAGWVSGRLSLVWGLTSGQTARELLINEPTHLSLQSLT